MTSHQSTIAGLILLLMVLASSPSRSIAKDSTDGNGADNTAATKPNIVMIISDDQAWTDYGFMGHDTIQTPRLDELASRSVRFDRGYVPTALCRPSLATLLTGHYPSVHGITGNDPALAGLKKDSPQYAELREKMIANIDRFETLPARLAKVGYLSHQSGKLWEGSYQRSGFTHGMTRGFPKPGGRHGDDGLTIGRKGMQPISEFLDLAVEEKKPFFIWYAPFLPHTPHNPPPRILSKYTNKVDSPSVAKYYAMCEWFDETCGQLVDEVSQRKLDSNTLFVYVTDNGWIQDPASKKFAPRSKQSANEGGTRTPILFRWLNELKPVKRDELVSSIDLFPTLLAAAGAEIPDGLPGLNLMPVLRKGTPIDRERIFGESFAHDVANLDDPNESLLYRWVIEDQWKLLVGYPGKMGRYGGYHADRKIGAQLFDLKADPTETQDLASQHPEIVARLSKNLDQWYEVPELVSSQ